MTPRGWLILAGTLMVVLLVLNRTGWIRFPTGLFRSAQAEFLAFFLLLGVGIPLASSGQIPIYWGVIAVALGVVVAGSASARDYVYGLTIRWEERIKPGDTISLQGAEGVVSALRRLHVVLDDGTGEVLVPYSVLVKEVVHRRSPMSGALPHRFTLEWDGAASHEEVAAAVRRVALLHPWGGGGREAVFEAVGARQAEVTVYAIEGGRGFEIERTIRDAVSEL